MKLINKLKNHYIAKCNYIKHVDKLPLDEHVIALESQQGKEFGGNMYYIIKELLKDKDYASFQLCLCVQKEKTAAARRFTMKKAYPALRSWKRIQSTIIV